jgi:hypothetical protein
VLKHPNDCPVSCYATLCSFIVCYVLKHVMCGGGQECCPGVLQNNYRGVAEVLQGCYKAIACHVWRRPGEGPKCYVILAHVALC